MDIIKRSVVLWFMAFPSIACAVPEMHVTAPKVPYVVCSNSLDCCRSKGYALFRPMFLDSKINEWQINCAIFIAISYSRFNLADSIRPKPFHAVSRHGRADELTCPPMPFLVKGVDVSDMSVRVTPFAVSPPLSENVLHCMAVSFFAGRIQTEGTYIYTVYVNDSDGKAGLTLQECSGYVDFLKEAVQFPCVSPKECETQRQFYADISRRKYQRTFNVAPSVKQAVDYVREHKIMVGFPDLEIEDGFLDSEPDLTQTGDSL